MQIEIRRTETGAYNLVVNGRTEIWEESLAVVEGVADSLRYGAGGGGCRELDEIATVIYQRWAGEADDD